MHRLRRKLEEFAGPRLPLRVRLGAALIIVGAGYVCYRWHLLHAREFEALGLAVVFLLLLVRRIRWKARIRDG